MTDYNDGEWHGWSGGECPVHEKAVIDVVYPNGNAYKECNAGTAGWYGPMLFRVVTPYVEPAHKLEFWVNVYEDGAVALHESKEEADQGAVIGLVRCVHMIEADGA